MGEKNKKDSGILRKIFNWITSFFRSRKRSARVQDSSSIAHDITSDRSLIIVAPSEFSNSVSRCSLENPKVFTEVISALLPNVKVITHLPKSLDDKNNPDKNQLDKFSKLQELQHLVSKNKKYYVAALSGGKPGTTTKVMSDKEKIVALKNVTTLGHSDAWPIHLLSKRNYYSPQVGDFFYILLEAKTKEGIANPIPLLAYLNAVYPSQKHVKQSVDRIEGAINMIDKNNKDYDIWRNIIESAKKIVNSNDIFVIAEDHFHECSNLIKGFVDFHNICIGREVDVIKSHPSLAHKTRDGENIASLVQNKLPSYKGEIISMAINANILANMMANGHADMYLARFKNNKTTPLVLTIEAIRSTGLDLEIIKEFERKCQEYNIELKVVSIGQVEYRDTPGNAAYPADPLNSYPKIDTVVTSFENLPLEKRRGYTNQLTDDQKNQLLRMELNPETKKMIMDSKIDNIGNYCKEKGIIFSTGSNIGHYVKKNEQDDYPGGNQACVLGAVPYEIWKSYSNLEKNNLATLQI